MAASSLFKFVLGPEFLTRVYSRRAYWPAGWPKAIDWDRFFSRNQHGGQHRIVFGEDRPIEFQLWAKKFLDLRFGFIVCG